MSLWGRVKAAVQAFVRPERIAPPPLPTPPTVREDRDVTRPPSPRRSALVPRSDLPRSWGRNKAALWRDATAGEDVLARDPMAQRFYDAALYTFADTKEQRKRNIDNFKQYIADEYGLDWDDIFDWEDWRGNYDATASAR